MNKRHIIFSALVLVGLTWFGCEPMELDKPNIGNAPTAEQLDFTITPGDDAFHFVITNTSTVKGIANWDLGNGVKAVGNSVTAYYPIAKTYNITLTLYASGGSTSKTKEFEQTETDWPYLESPIITALTGGVDAPNGKTWVIDSLTEAHLGVGPADSYSPVWWAAAPLAKSGHYLYDDEFTFKLVGFTYTIDTHGKTHVNHDGNADEDGLSAGYYVSSFWNDAYDIDMNTNDAARGELTWSISEENGKYYIQISSQSGNISYDDGNPRKYEVLEWNENFFHLRSVGGAARYHKIIPKGYIRPTISYTLNITATAIPNEYTFALEDLTVPSSFTISNITYDFGDGSSYQTTDGAEVVTHTYMRKGNYNAKVTVTANGQDFVKTSTVAVAANHPTYQEYLLDAMVMYNDFGETTLVPMQVDQSDGGATLEIVTNPNNTLYPNRSAHCALFTKYNSQWANAYTRLPDGYRFDLTKQTVFKVLVYGKAGDQVLLKLENTDRGGNAWQTGTHDLIYTIQNDNKWEIAEFNFAGVGAGWDWTGDIFTGDVTTDSRFNKDFYNVVRIMINPGNNGGTFSVHLDDLAGPHIEGLK